MYKREYSLKTRYNFRKVFESGETFVSHYFVIKYLKVKPEVFESDVVNKKFAVITSNKLTSKKVHQAKIRRLIAKQIVAKLERFPAYYYYVFVPKKTIIDFKRDKIIANDQDLSSQINTFLSKIPKL